MVVWPPGASLAEDGETLAIRDGYGGEAAEGADVVLSGGWLGSGLAGMRRVEAIAGVPVPKRCGADAGWVTAGFH